MNTSYEITIKIRTPDGVTDIGSFSLGTDLDFALSTFSNLKGKNNDSDNAVICLCLVEKSEKASPRQLNSIGCILNEYAENTKIIARDIFKFLSLEK